MAESTPVKKQKPTIQENLQKIQEKHDKVDELVNKLLNHFLKEDCMETTDKYYYYTSNIHYASEDDKFEKRKILYYSLSETNRLVLITTITDETTLNILFFLLGYVFNEHCAITGGNGDFFNFFTDIYSTKETIIEHFFDNNQKNEILEFFDDDNGEELEEVQENEKVKELLLEACDFDSWLHLLQRYYLVEVTGNNEHIGICSFKQHDELPQKKYNYSNKNSQVVSEDMWRIDKYYDQCIYTIKDLIHLNNSNGGGYVLK